MNEEEKNKRIEELEETVAKLKKDLIDAYSKLSNAEARRLDSIANWQALCLEADWECMQYEDEVQTLRGIILDFILTK